MDEDGLVLNFLWNASDVEPRPVKATVTLSHLPAYCGARWSVLALFRGRRDWRL